ncbi:MAG: universal stress protein UspA [Pedosphaera sp.]|nr:universal stress protein UspA [Pedosphaera sp.]
MPIKHLKGRLPAKPDIKSARGATTRSTNPGASRSEPSLLKLKRILVPTDFSEPSLKALRYAVPFAKRFGATIFLAHVLERTPFIAGDQSVVLVVPERELVKDAKEKLLSLAADEIEELVPVDTQVRMGKPFAEIVTLATELEIDLIIVATHGYTGLRHVLLGSTTERIVRRASCPVLVVREQEHEFV